MANAAGHSNDQLKEMLKSAIQSVQWTYIIFWQFCPDERVLVWGDGYYNGAIKTRKTLQSMEVSAEEAALSRSEQLRELYDSLASGDQRVTENQQAAIRGPSVALSPEDLTESEWFYLMCVSFSFAPGVGLVGEAYAKQQHLWLTGAHEVDSKVYTRAILAKSAYIQTVICIPLLNGIVELGTTEKVEETNEFIQHVKLFFTIGNDMTLPHPKPALSAHSSNTTFSPYQTPDTIKLSNTTYSMDEDVDDDEDDDDDDEGEDIQYDNTEDVCDDEDVDENGPDFAKESCHVSSLQDTDELLRLALSRDIKFGSPNAGSNNLDSQFNLLATSLEDSYRAESTPGWSDNFELHNPSHIHLHTSSEELALEDTRYSQTVTTILNKQPTRCSNSNTPTNHNPSYSTQSSFATWTPNPNKPYHLPTTSQRILKYILFTLPFLYSTTTTTTVSKPITPLRKTTPSHEDLSASHVLAERRRREKLNERFIILRTLVPLVTKMDKASILGDTIEYVKQLRKRVQDLENAKVAEKRKIRAVEGGNGGVGRAAVAVQVEVEVSIIENDALVEMQCRYRDGLLLDVMKKLRELGVEIITVQSCVDSGVFTAEMRAKVKMRKGNNGRKISITQVKKAIDQIISP